MYSHLSINCINWIWGTCREQIVWLDPDCIMQLTKSFRGWLTIYVYVEKWPEISKCHNDLALPGEGRSIFYSDPSYPRELPRDPPLSLTFQWHGLATNRGYHPLLGGRWQYKAREICLVLFRSQEFYCYEFVQCLTQWDCSLGHSNAEEECALQYLYGGFTLMPLVKSQRSAFISLMQD